MKKFSLAAALLAVSLASAHYTNHVRAPELTTRADDDFTEATDFGQNLVANEKIAKPATEEEQRREELANTPDAEIDTQDAHEISLLETDFFAHFVTTSPAGGDPNALVLPTNVSCASKPKRSLLGSEFLGGMLQPRHLESAIDARAEETSTSCEPITSLDIDVYFNYIRATSTVKQDPRLNERIPKQVSNTAQYVQVIRPAS
jgi:hypothetical protein